MTDKEKARAYDEALDRCKEWVSGTWGHSIDDTPKDVAEFIFPELAESEDERIRKGLISYFEIIAGDYFGEFKKSDIIAYLEKQKEQKHYWKPTETDVALFNKAVTTNNTLTPAERANLDIIRSKFSCCHAINCSGIMQKEQKSKNELENAFKYYTDRGVTISCEDFEAEPKKEQKPTEWSEEDENMLNSCISSIEEAKENRYYYRETDGDTSYDHEISWLKSLRPQPKQEWSVEDKLMVKCCLKALEYYKYTGKRGQFMPARFDIGGYLASVEKVENWLKSIRPVSKESLQSWKPSEEQMEAVKHAYNSFPNDCPTKSNLRLLYHDLEKLGVREEPEYYQHFDPDC